MLKSLQVCELFIPLFQSNKSQMEVSEMIALLIEPTIKQPQKLYRLDAAGDRQYYYLREDGKPVFFQSVTTAIRNNMPTSPQLIKWIGDMGTEEAEAYRDERAAFGTFMHITFESYLLNKQYNLDAMESELQMYLDREGEPISLASKWLREQQKALLGFAQFITDYKVRPIAVEIALCSHQMGIAGMLDLVCDIDIEEKGFFGEVYKSGDRKGEPKESKVNTTVRAIVDFKSGKNFYDDHAIQLDIYRRMWNENFPELPVTHIFNWSPSDWRGNTPTFKLKDQSENPVLWRVPYVIQQNVEMNRNKSRVATIMSGIVTNNPSENIEVIDYTEYITKKHESKN